MKAGLTDERAQREETIWTDIQGKLGFRVPLVLHQTITELLNKSSVVR